MARTTAPVEISSFVKGLVTEAGPLTFPANASIDEDNFVLKRDGSRNRRLGMDLEENNVKISTSVSVDPGEELGMSTYRWDNAGGDSTRAIAVVQIAEEIKFFDLDSEPLSAGLLGTHTFAGVAEGTIFSFATVDGLLVVATGNKEVSTFEFDGTTTFTLTESTLQVRDLFGVEDVILGENLRNGSGVSTRPATLPDTHNYNLRNQTWAEPRLQADNTITLHDPIIEFEQAVFGDTGVNGYPSNADSVLPVLYADAARVANRTADRFHAEDLYRNPLGNTPAPNGYFIIDALSRGQSRLDEVAKLGVRHPEVNPNLPAILPADVTPGGASVVAEFGGHVWFGGFSSEVTNGDNNSPRMGSYILFSQLVEDATDIGKCYQSADPTSRDQSDLVPTDGGFIRIDGAYGIVGLVNIGLSLVVVASNGVWEIAGGNEFGFAADNYRVRKVTDRGCLSPKSIVVIDNSLMYWAQDAIYQVGPGEGGLLTSQNLTQNTIQEFYNDIDSVDKFYAQGIFDDFDRTVRWVYRNRLSDSSQVRELVLDLALVAFYPVTIGDLTNNLPVVLSGLKVQPFRTRTDNEDVVAGNDLVLFGTEQVVSPVRRTESVFRSTFYVVVTQQVPTIEFTFSSYRDTSFADWVSVDGTGVDAPAFLITGWSGGGDFQRFKQVPYVTFHMRKTEDGMTVDGNGDLFPSNPSGMLVQAQWDWANSSNSNRWGRSFQAYRHKRQYMPVDVNDAFDTGFEVISTKNKLRGKGKVLSLRLETEPAKDCKLLGWSLIMGVNGNV